MPEYNGVLVPEEVLPLLANAGRTDLDVYGYRLLSGERVSRLLRRAGLRTEARHFSHRWRFAANTPFDDIRSIWFAPDAQFDSREARELLARLPALRSVYWQRTGLDSLPVAEFVDRGVRVTSGRGLTTRWVAEAIVACILADAKMLTLSARGHIPPLSCFTRALDSLHVAILGTGQIGRETARLCQGLGMRVTGLSRTEEARATLKSIFTEVRLASNALQSTAAEADYLVLALPLTAESREIVGAEVLDALGSRGVLVNLARPGLVDEPAMLRALERRRLGAAYVSRLGGGRWIQIKSRWTPHLFLTNNREAHMREKSARAAEQFLAMLDSENLRIYHHR